MKALATFLVVILCSNFAFSDSRPDFLFPKPDSKYNKISTSITFRPEGSTAQNFLNKNSVRISGEKSGLHEFSTRIADDNKTIILTPLIKFSLNEKVEVKVLSNMKVQKYSITFETEKQEIKSDVVEMLKKENPSLGETGINAPYISSRNSNTDTLPPDFPVIQITNSSAPSPGKLFFSNFTFGAPNAGHYLIIMDNAGGIIFHKRMTSQSYDFKKQPNGNLTYYSQGAEKFFEMNSSYQIVDSFYCGNGYTTDLHELRILNNKHALLMSYDTQIMDLRGIVPNGDSAVFVTGLIIQEIDAGKNVVFQWRSWDHFNINGARHEDLTAGAVDYVHGNAIELDNDGNLLISSRHLDEITKINRSTGEIIWRLGGKYNQFTFPNDSLAFSYQHNVRRLANGNILLFDNGNYREANGREGEALAPYSRAVEYSLDEENHIATLVWEYRRSPDIYGFAMGNAERLPNGNTLICWGATNPNITEVNTEGEIVFEITFSRGTFTYRAFRDSWNSTGLYTSSDTETPENFVLYQNYPNPFNPSTTIKFNIPQKSEVLLTIYNSIGEEIEDINFGNKNAGSYEYKWNASALASGIYFYQLKTETFTQAKQMILLK